jgi:hypothetical protein
MARETADAETRSVLARGIKGKVALGISSVAWVVIFLVALWIATEPSAGVSDPRSSLRSAIYPIFVPSLCGWLVSTLSLFLIFAAADGIRHRVQRLRGGGAAGAR